jgi:hypothetical protein
MQERQTDRIKGLVQLETYAGDNLPLEDWNITGVLEDIIMVEYADTDPDGKGDTILRRGLHVPVDLARHTWRVGRVLLCGPKVPDAIKEGTCVIFPNDKGIRAANFNGKREVVFLNAERIFGVCTPKDGNPAAKKKK